MASVRDVLDHAGKPVRIEGTEGTVRDGKAMRRGEVALVEARLAPRENETLILLETGERFRIAASTPEIVHDRVDHYRVALAPAGRG